MGTKENLQAAFAGESQANRRYLFFAEKADAEGLKQLARLFRAAAEAETVHARNHLKALDGIKSIRENLAAAINGEHYEFTEMYPGFIKQAGDNPRAKNSFDLANKVEQIHYDLYRNALQAVEESRTVPESSYYVCQVCGNTVEGNAPERCPVCGSSQKSFKRID